MRVQLRANARAGVSLECDDDTYYVIVDGEVHVATAVESYARIAYSEAVEERTDAAATRARERTAHDIQAARWEGFGTGARSGKKRGGKGGRGGV